MIKSIHSTLFYVADLGATEKFYTSLGFSVEKFDGKVRIKIGDFRLAFIDENKTSIKNEAGVKPKGIGVFTYVEVENVDEYFAWLKEHKVETRSEPKTWPWGKREFVVKDPDGYKLVFYTSTK